MATSSMKCQQHTSTFVSSLYLIPPYRPPPSGDQPVGGFRNGTWRYGQRWPAAWAGSDGSDAAVFLYDSGDDKPFTAGKFAMPTAMIEALGATNITADMNTSWGTTSWEAVAAADPEFLILLDYQSGGGAADLMAFLKEHPVMKHTTAVKQEAYVPLRYEELTPGPANIEAIAKMADAMKQLTN